MSLKVRVVPQRLSATAAKRSRSQSNQGKMYSFPNVRSHGAWFAVELSKTKLVSSFGKRLQVTARFTYVFTGDNGRL